MVHFVVLVKEIWKFWIQPISPFSLYFDKFRWHQWLNPSPKSTQLTARISIRVLRMVRCMYIVRWATMCFANRYWDGVDLIKTCHMRYSVCFIHRKLNKSVWYVHVLSHECVDAHVSVVCDITIALRKLGSLEQFNELQMFELDTFIRIVCGILDCMLC